jgi:hypothetical protein
LLEIPITFDLPLAIFSSSPSVLTSSFDGDDARPLAPSSCRLSSDTLVTCLPSSRSYHSLPTMPLTEGVAPVSIVEWPMAVTVGKCS